MYVKALGMLVALLTVVNSNNLPAQTIGNENGNGNIGSYNGNGNSGNNNGNGNIGSGNGNGNWGSNNGNGNLGNYQGNGFSGEKNGNGPTFNQGENLNLDEFLRRYRLEFRRLREWSPFPS